MKATVTSDTTFALTVNGVQFLNLRKVSSWNGLTELANGRGEKLIVSGMESDSGFGKVFDTLFGDIFRTGAQTDEMGVTVVMGSPSLMAQLQPTV